jgi:caa(3)-type oxidase subunit IV
MSHIESTTRVTLLRVYLALLALLVLTAFSARLPTGAWSLPLALTIATAKLVLIFYFFMQLRTHRGLVWIFAAAGFFWLAIAGTLTFADYLTRHWRF